MKQLVFGVILGSLLFGGAVQANVDTQGRERRFQIFFRDGIQADTFLLDQDDGRVWQMVVDSQKNQYWQEMRVTVFTGGK